jgi:hypothetical protein
MGLLDQELTDKAGSQAEGQIVVGAVLLSLVTGAGGLAASEELFDVRGALDAGGQAQLTEEGLFTLAQGQGGFAFELEYPSHIHY